MHRLMAIGMTVLGAVAPTAQAPAPKELKAFVVSVTETTITLSNVALGSGGGETFVMPAPKPGEPAPTWVAGSSTPSDGAEARPRMRMITQGDANTPLTLTELQIAKGTVKVADFPAGTLVVVTYRETNGKKLLQKIERSGPQ